MLTTRANLIGSPRRDLPTPALVIDRSAAERNIAAMAGWARGKTALRPHAKVHKCVEIATRQLDAGAVGVTVATVAEAIAMIASGAPEILIANEVAGSDRIRSLVAVAERTSLIVAFDNTENAQAISEAARTAGVEIGALIDIDVGMHRCGVRSSEEALTLAREISSLPGLVLRGVMGYEGHVVLEPDRKVRAQLVTEAMDELAAHVDRLRASGFSIDIVSAGGTNTHDMTGLHPAVTELQAGTYAVMDVGYAPFAVRFEPCLYVAATVVSRQGRRAVLDCGTKVLCPDVSPPRLPEGCGVIREVHEEHALIDVPEGSELRVGDHLEVAPGYAGGTINLHDVYHVVEGDTVVDLWPVVARGPGRPAALAPLEAKT